MTDQQLAFQAVSERQWVVEELRPALRTSERRARDPWLEVRERPDPVVAVRRLQQRSSH